jgi:hypothetical protein
MIALRLKHEGWNSLGSLLSRKPVNLMYYITSKLRCEKPISFTLRMKPRGKSFTWDSDIQSS